MNSSDSEETRDTELIAWGQEIDEIMTIAVKNAIEENKKLGLYAEGAENSDSQQVAEDS